MSLNWREIDAVLSEIDLAGSHVQQVIQPDFRNLYLEIFRPGRRFYLRICLETGVSRIHSTDRKPRKPPVRQRFAQLLHSRIKGARIVDVRQLNADRIVRFTLERAGETTLLWVRLWGGAANCIATDEDGNVLDAFFRRPKKGEVSGGTFAVHEVAVDVENEPRLQRFTPRWTESVDESIRRHYEDLETTERRKRLIETASASLRSQEAAARRRLADLEKKQAVVADADRYQTLGDLITSNLYRISTGDAWIEVEDYTQDNQAVSVELDPALTAQANAARYYDRAQKARRRSDAIEEEILNLHSRLERIETDAASLEEQSTSDLESLVAASAASGRANDVEARIPGLQFESRGFTILVGRNARENDALLRRHVRGNDVWLHARDYPGGYVFVKSKRGKTLPLDVLLDAGNLAIHYSKAKSNGRADLYYTQVKFLRRAKDGPKGLVLPTQEKNLHVVVDKPRLSRLGIGRLESAR